MLLFSPRHSVADLEAWRHREAADAYYARRWRSRLAALERQACDDIAAWLPTQARPYVSASWGKDSVVAAFLTRRVNARIPIVYIRFEGHANPDCDLVRDQYLQAWPTPYEESEMPWSDDWSHIQATRYGPARIQGIRADESATRAMSAMVHGVSTTNICRPVLSWSCADIFAYSYLHDLPLHPAYACSYGGQLEREALRVDVLIGDYIDPINTPGDGMGRLEWERQYYPEVR